jgi:dienelactone hydrolase
MRRNLHRKSLKRSLSISFVCASALVASAYAAIAIQANVQGVPSSDRRSTEIRHTDLKYAPPVYATREEWLARAAFLRKQILASAGLSPMPERPAIKPMIFGRVDRGDHTIEKVIFESLPGFYVTGNLYRPKNVTGKVPAVLTPHGHWTYGRLENTATASVPARAINLARMGIVVFSYDMVGYDDSIAISHRFATGHREGFDVAALWSINLLGLQLWNSIRSLDFLLTLPEVDASRIGSTGASGGATQAFLHAAVDERVKVTAPVNMISSIMQGGSLCENAPNLRIDTNNMELGALTAPRPMLMVSATGDWTRNTMTVEYPAVRGIYRLLASEENLQAVQINAPHNYNQESREAVYGWFAHHLLGKPGTGPIKERSTSIPLLSESLVFFGRERPANELDESALEAALIARARAQIAEAFPRDAASLERFQQVFGENLKLSLMAEYPKAQDILVEQLAPSPPSTPGALRLEKLAISRRGREDRVDGSLQSPSGTAGPGNAVLIVNLSGAATTAAERSKRLADLLVRRGRAVLTIECFTARRPKNDFKFFTTYNRSDDANRIQDILTAIAFLKMRYPGASLALVGEGPAGLLALLARGLSPALDKVAIDAAGFDTASDEAFLHSLPIPGIRRAGDFATAVFIAPTRPLMIYNTQGRFGTEQMAAAFRLFGRSADLKINASLPSAEALVEWLAP